MWWINPTTWNTKINAAREAPEFLDPDYYYNGLYEVERMSLEDTQEKLEWNKRDLECKQKITYGIENLNDIVHIHDKEVNKITECNLLHDIINPHKCTKILNIHYSPILHGCMNTRNGKAKFKDFRVLLDSACSSMIVMGRLVENLHHEKYSVMQWHTQAGNITTNHKFELDFTLPALSATNVVMWKCHADDFAKGRYNMILGQYLLT